MTLIIHYLKVIRETVSKKIYNWNEDGELSSVNDSIGTSSQACWLKQKLVLYIFIKKKKKTNKKFM